MKKLIIPLIIACSNICFAFDQQEPKVDKNDMHTPIVFKAVTDFTTLQQGQIPYYLDKRNNALAIDARIFEYRHLFAQASMKFDEKSEDYDINIKVLTEEDGEPIYRLLVNNNLVGTYRSTYIGAHSDQDLQPENHTWKSIKLNKGDILSIESSTHSNGEIPEKGGTAWARGRWQQLALTPAKKNSYPRAQFSPHKDLLVAQFDSKPDADDIHAIAALGSMLTHADMDKVNYIGVSGAVGIQKGKYIDAPNLFTLAFGRENLHWTNAHKNWQRSVNMIRDRARAVILQGGNVWVQEAGQSDFTRDWVKALIASGLHDSLIKNNVIVVQHSAWNEKNTSVEALDYVKQKTRYQAINDGNEAMKEFNRKGRRGALTPSYVSADQKWLETATSAKNTKTAVRNIWLEAQRIVEQSGFNAKYSVIPQGGVDFSDAVENWWIFDIGHRAPSVHAFWKRYVTTVELDKINPPKGRLAIVIDGNSPDPDDIGATPVMFGLLQQANLRDRLVHLSHSCDLDPFRNKGKQQINAENELRRQKKLHELSGKGIELFGPFANLRNYYNCREHQEEAINDLKEAINHSSLENPLWIIEAGEPDVIGYALENANPQARQYVHVISHHPANDDSGDYFTWQQILDFGVTEHQIGDQNVGLQTPTYYWHWAKNNANEGIRFIWEMLAYAEADGVVPFQANKFDCSDAGMLYWWISGANQGGNNSSTPVDMKEMLLLR